MIFVLPIFRRLARDRRGGSAAEYAMVLPLLLVFIFAVIDGGRFMWRYNRAEKATQAGARVAAVTQIIPSGLAASWVGVTVNGTILTQGDIIPASAIGTIICKKPAGTLICDCQSVVAGVTCLPINTTGWDAIVSRVKLMEPAATDANILVEYRDSGLGYAGDPSGLDIAPLVTVKLKDLTFQPASLLIFGKINYDMPVFATTLTAEDSVGTHSN
ncbi:TadE/TadG family type IV pilus assembly protein [Sphingomonas sp. RB1R13]|uniref:TadE/TadG family type IV pilus assembly protein n=1 Tax=Sphingomonas sp. RB1R13 TaxID=3096159 RepID=UPI002FC9A940